MCASKKKIQAEAIYTLDQHIKLSPKFYDKFLKFKF